MTTTFEEQRNRHLIYPGYIRLNCEQISEEYNISLTFPSAIISIIIAYFINSFEWDSEKCDKVVTISEDKLTVNNKRGGNGAVLAKNLLSSSALKAVNWEITLKTMTARNVGFCMGYVEHDRTQSVEFGTSEQLKWIGNSQGQRSLSVVFFECAFETFHECVFEKSYHGMYEKYDKKWDPKKVKQGDKFEIQFDFIKKESSCYWNGNLIGILDDKLPDKVYPAITTTGNHEFECTKWELFYINR